MIVRIGGALRDLGAVKPSRLKLRACKPSVDVAALPMQFSIDGFPTDYDQGELGACHDDKTEVLTSTGWRLFSQLTGDELLATVDPANSLLTYEKPTRLVRYQYSGEMICARNAYLDFKVTPDHKMLVRTWNQAQTTLNEHYELVSAGEIGWYVGLLNNVRWGGAARTDTFTLRGVDHHHVPQRSDVDVSMRTWLRFLGLYLAEGTMIGPVPSKEASYKIQIAASKEREKTFARAILAELGVKAYEEPDRFQFTNRRIFETLEALGLRGVHAPDKFVPAFVFEQSAEMIEEFLLGHFMGDGSEARGIRAHYTSSSRLAEDLQRLVFLAGHESGLTVREPRTSTMADGRIVVGRHPEHRVSVRAKRRASIERRETIFREHYDGEVFCAEVPTHHTLVTRREGCILISGNCGPNSAAEVYEFDLKAKFSRLWLYYLTRAAEHDVDQDGGVELPDMMSILHVMGMPLESEWDYHVDAFRQVPPPIAFVDALKHRLDRWDVIADLEHALFEIANEQPITLGFHVPASMQLEDTARTGLVKVPSGSDPCIGGHAVNAIGFDRARELVRCTCHYGPTFGDGGTIWLPFAMFTSGNVHDLSAMRSIS